jgi:hypothetical protein
MKTVADALRDLDSPVKDETLVLNLMRGFSPHYAYSRAILTRITPFPSFARLRGDLLLEELMTAATTTTDAATTLYNANPGGQASQVPPLASVGWCPLARALVHRHLAPLPDYQLWRWLSASLEWSWSRRWPRWFTRGLRPRLLAVLLHPMDRLHLHVAWTACGSSVSPDYPSTYLLRRSTPLALPAAPTPPHFQPGLLPPPPPLLRPRGALGVAGGTQSLVGFFSMMTLTRPTSLSD